MLRSWLLVLALALAACGPVRSRATEARLDVADAARAARLSAAAASLLRSLPQGGRTTVVLSRRPGLGAWARRSGRIEVTPALVDLLDDDELAAAVAHELGHLVAGGHVDAAAALAGAGDAAGEERADAVGCRLLAASGRPTGALPRLLRRLGPALGECDFAARAATAEAGACATP
ncbi:MAG: M48 family metalloprotease [bacterium]|nr:M48 family metalloprotease [bacterium]